MKKRIGLFALFLLGSLSAFAQEDEGKIDILPIEEISIRQVAYAGSGCPVGSLVGSLSADARSLSLQFDSMIAEVGLGLLLSESRKNCHVALEIDHPNEFTYSVMGIDYDGYVDIGSGVKATQTTQVYFQGDSKTTTLTTPFYGPLAGDFHIRDTLNLQAEAKGRLLNINTSVRLHSYYYGGSGLIALSNMETGFKHLLSLEWKRRE